MLIWKKHFHSWFMNSDSLYLGFCCLEFFELLILWTRWPFTISTWMTFMTVINETLKKRATSTLGKKIYGIILFLSFKCWYKPIFPLSYLLWYKFSIHKLHSPTNFLSYLKPGYPNNTDNPWHLVEWQIFHLTHSMDLGIWRWFSYSLLPKQFFF